MASMKKQFKIVACFFLLTVLLRGVSVADACEEEHGVCAEDSDCCTGLVCIEGECENEACEDHVGHHCDPEGRDCCEPLVCDCNQKCAVCKGEGERCDDCFAECCDLDCVNMGDGTFECHVGGN